MLFSIWVWVIFWGVLCVFEIFPVPQSCFVIPFKAPAMLEVSVLRDGLRKSFVCLHDTLNESKTHCNIAA